MKRLFFVPLLLLLAVAAMGAVIEVPEAPAWMLIAAGGAGGEADVTAPEISSGTAPAIDAAGTTLTITFKEACTEGASYADSDWTLSCSTTGPLTVAHNGGTATAWDMDITGGPVQESGTDTCTLDWAGTENGVEDGSGNDLAAIDPPVAITNNSTQGGCTTANDEEPINDGTTSWAQAVTDGGTAISETNWQSQAFTIAGSGTATITEIVIHIGWWDPGGDSDSFTIEIQTDNGDDPSGSVITNGSVTANADSEATAGGCTGCANQTLVFATAPTVTKGAQYHFVVKGVDGTFYLGRQGTGTHDSGANYTVDSGSTWLPDTIDLLFSIDGCD